MFVSQAGMFEAAATVLSWVLAGAIAAFLFSKQLERTAGRQGRAEFQPGEVVLREQKGVQFVGQRSRGYFQLRMPGTLRLTDRRLIYEMWLPRRNFTIDLRSIRELDAVDRFLGEPSWPPLLSVRYRPRHRVADEAAWRVGAPESWIADIERARAALRDAREARRKELFGDA